MRFGRPGHLLGFPGKYWFWLIDYTTWANTGHHALFEIHSNSNSHTTWMNLICISSPNTTISYNSQLLWHPYFPSAWNKTQKMGNGSTALPISIRSQVNTQGQWRQKGGHLQVGEKLTLATLATGLRPWNLVRSLESSDSKDEIHGVGTMIFCLILLWRLAQMVL